MGCGPTVKTPRGYTAVTSSTLQSSLARRLIPVADRIRDLYTRFGERPYTLSLIKTRWSLGKRGRGVEEITFTRVIDPTPLITDLSTLTEVVQPVGEDEIGPVRVEQISGEFTEDMLRGFDDQGNPPTSDEQIFFVVEFPVPGDGPGVMRRFSLRNAPMYLADKFQWQIGLERSHQDPARNGDLR